MGSDHSTAEGARRDAHKKERLFRVRWLSDLSKSTGNVGQKAKDNRRDLGCQCDIG